MATEAALLINSSESDGIEHALQHLAGPLKGGLTVDELAFDGATCTVSQAIGPNTSVQAVLLHDLDATGLELVFTYKLGAQPQVKRSITFEPYSATGTALAAILPADGAFAAGLKLSVKAGALAGNGKPIIEQARLRLVTGVFANMLYLAELETSRLRRTIRQLNRQRLLEVASGPLLDRIGAELAVPRLTDELSFPGGALTVKAVPESDPAYRRRLAPYRQFVLPTAKALGVALDAAGFSKSAAILEGNRPPDVAIRIIGVGPGGAQLRLDYLDKVRRNVLLDPGAAVLPARIRGAAEAALEQKLNADLRAAIGNPGASRPIAPALADGLLRALRLSEALGVASPFGIAKGQVMAADAANSADSRYELGIGAELTVNAAADHALPALLNAPPAALSAADRRAAALAASYVAKGNSPVAALLLASGIATTMPTGPDMLFVSTFTTGGIDVTGPVEAVAGSVYTLIDRDDPTSARWRGELEAAANGSGLAVTALDAAAITAAANGGLSDPAGDLATFLIGNMLTTGKPDALKPAMGNAAAEGLVGVRIDGPDGTALRNGDAAAIAKLTTFIAELVRRGVPGVAVALPAGAEVIIVAGPRGVPPLGTNLSGRAASQHRWYVTNLGVPERSGGARMLGTGKTLMLPKLPAGLYALIGVTQRRGAFADPYEVRVAPVQNPETLDFARYEELLNLLARFRPAGIEINTWLLRKGAVRFDPAQPTLPPSVKNERSYRKYKLRRFAGWTPPASGK